MNAIVALGAMTLAACSSDSTSPLTTPAAIAAISGNGQSASVGTPLTSPIVFEVTTAADAPVSGVTVSFAVTSGTATLAPTTVVTDANGTASTFVTLGGTAGNVEITATVKGLSARASATATQLASTDCTTSGTTLTLGQVVTGVSGSSLCVAGGTSGGDFVLVPFNSTLSGSSSASLSFQALNVGATTAASLTPSPNTFNLLAGVSLQRSVLASLDLTSALDAKLRASEARELAPRIAGAREWMAARRRSASGAIPGLSLSVTSSTAAVGDFVSLNANANSACSSPDMRTGRVAAVSSRAIVVADTTNPSGGYTDADYQSIASKFDNLVDPTDTRAFGQPTDIDGNGHVVLFFTRAVNQLTPANSSSYVAGFFYARDLFPATAANGFQACASSNGGEMFYLLVPDPNGVVNGNRFTKDAVTRVAISTVAHEYQHLINASRRMYVNTASTDFEETWLDEGLAHVAEELLFFAESGLSPRANIDATLLRTSSTYVDAFNNDAISNFGRLGQFLAAPSSNSPFADDDELATRGATWSFLRYAADHTAGEDNAKWMQLVNSTTTGLANLSSVFGSNLTTLVRSWATSIFTDDLTTTDAGYQQPTWNLRSLFAALQTNGAYPLATNALGASSPVSVNVSGGSAAYLRFSVAAGQTAQVQWNTLPANVQLTLVRTR
jgi:hypothetical protein